MKSLFTIIDFVLTAAITFVVVGVFAGFLAPIFLWAFDIGWNILA